MPLIGGDGINDAEYITRAGPTAEGTYASGVGVPLVHLPGAAEFSAAYAAAGYTAAPTDYGPYAYDATNVVIDALRTPLAGKQQLPTGIRQQVVRDVQHTEMDGVTGSIGFDRYGDTDNPRFTLYRVEGTPLVWTQDSP